MQLGGGSQLGGACKTGGGESLARQYYRILKSPGISPPGVWADDDQTLRNRLLMGDAKAVADRARRTVEGFQKNVFGGTAYETLPEWESDLGIANAGGLSFEQRRANIVARIRAAGYSSLPVLKAALAPALNPVYGFRDEFADGVLSAQIVSAPRLGTVVEATNALTCTITNPANGRFDAGGIACPTASIRLVDFDDDFEFEVFIGNLTLGAGCSVGAYVMNRWEGLFDSAIIEYDISAGVQARTILTPQENGPKVQTILGASGVALPTQYDSFVIRRVGNVYYLGWRQWSHPDVDRWIATEEIKGFVPMECGFFARNSSAAWASAALEASQIRIAYSKPGNNVEVIERLSSELAGGNKDGIFLSFVWRDPTVGEYDLRAAQAICDRMKHAERLILVGESKSFLTDDPYSLTDRDITGV